MSKLLATALTDLKGNTVWVVDSWVVAVREPIDGEYAKGAGAIVLLSGYLQAVKEDVQTVIDALAAD